MMAVPTGKELAIQEKILFLHYRYIIIKKLLEQNFSLVSMCKESRRHLVEN